MARSRSKRNLQEEIVLDKSFDPAVQERSVVDTPSVKEGLSPRTSLIFMVASAADLMIPWGAGVAARDKQLRDFFPTEPLLASAVYSVSARNASFAWELVPSDPFNSARNTRRAITRVLENAGNGIGWSRFIMKTCIDLYTQDNGAFWELIRASDRPDSPVIGINNLDSGRCTRTGDPATPVIYQDRYGRYHELQYYQVASIEEMPSPIEEMHNVQYSATTRALRLAQILKSIMVYKDEKVSGRNPRALDFVSGVGQTQIDDARKIAEEVANNAGFLRYAPAILVPGLDPSSAVTHVRVDLASLPDGFNFDDEMKWYIAALAMAFGVDYQEFAPLPSGALGSGKQSEILHLKTHGKGPATNMALFEHIINNCGIVPSDLVKFRYKDHDAQAEVQQAEARYTRGRDRALRLQSGELDPAAARHIAVEDGDLTEWIADDMETRGMEADLSTPSEANQGQMELAPAQISGPQQGQMQKIYGRGGMRGLKPQGKPVSIDEDAIDHERRAMRDHLNG